MITISDLNVSQESCLTELKDAEMMGGIVGGSLLPSLKNLFRFPSTVPTGFRLRATVTNGDFDLGLRLFTFTVGSLSGEINLDII